MKRISERKKRWIERTVANDRSYKRFLYNRFYLFALLVLFQLVAFGFFIYLVVNETRWGFIAQIVVGILAGICVLYILNKNDRPSSKLNWIMIILIFPIFGVPLYLLCGEGHPTWRMNRKLKKAKRENDERLQELYGKWEERTPESRAEGIQRYLFRFAGYPAYTGGKIDYYKCGEEMFPAMKEALESAKEYVLLEYFIIDHGVMWGEILEILLRKAAEGVKIRVIYDDFGCMTTLPPKYDRYLESLHENIRVLTFNEVVPMFAVRMNNRDHRKMTVVDGEVAFTGGINLADEYIAQKRRFGYWKDTGVRITGGGVQSFVRTFFGTWNAFYREKEDIGEYVKRAVNADMVCPSAKKGEPIIQPYDDSPLDNRSVGERVYVDMINRATRYVYIFTPYLLPDDTIRSALVRAGERGVDVRIVTPGIPDKKTIYRLTRANYGILLDAGVKIYEYTPGFMHAKSLVVDDESAVVGTINFDYRSLYLHFENAVYFTDRQAVQRVKQDCEEVFAVSKERTKENAKRSVVGKLVDSVLRVFETLM